MKLRSSDQLLGLFAAVFGLLLCCWVSPSGGAGSAMESECANVLPKVMDCLEYASGKANAPTEACCKSTASIKSSHPECLCLIIVQMHNGSSQIKSLGVQPAKLIQLPAACKLANSSVSDCPKLLNITSSSPDYALFTGNASSAATPATSSSSPAKNDESSGFTHGPYLGSSIGVAVVLFIVIFHAFPASGFASAIRTDVVE